MEGKSSKFIHVSRPIRGEFEISSSHNTSINEEICKGRGGGCGGFAMVSVINCSIFGDGQLLISH